MSDTGKAAVRAQFEKAEEIEPLADQKGQDLEAAPGDDRGGYGGPEDMPPDAFFGGGPGGDAPDLPIAALMAQQPLNDLGNGRRLIAHFGDDLAYVSRLGWFRWTGKVWEADEDEISVRACAHRLPDLILTELEFIQPSQADQRVLDQAEASAEQWAEISEKPVKDRDPVLYRSLRELREHAAAILGAQRGRRKSHRDWSRQTGNSGKLTNALLEARVTQAVPISVFNADPAAINCRSGVLRFRPDEHAQQWGQKAFSIEHSPHDRSDRITKICAASYDPDARAPVFEAFLARILPDPEIREFLQRWFGYSLTGFTTEHKLCFFYGAGRNGKSTLVDLIARVFADYATTVPIETLTGTEQRKGSDATPDLVRIPGARMVRASEPEEGQKMKEALIKALTGGEPILIRRMMQEFVEVVPEFKLTISGNHKPEIHGGDDGIWSRVLLIPFDERIPDSEIDQLLPEKLKGEADGVFAWIIEGARKWFTDGLKIPASVRQATADYREESDQIRTFLTSVVTVTGDPAHELTAKELIDAFAIWQIDNGGRPWSSRQISRKIKVAAENFRTPEGAQISWFKSSTSGYRGILLPDGIKDRLLSIGIMRRDAG